MNSKPTVFVIDDDPAVRQLMRWLIKSAGLDIETYGTAGAFLAACDPARPGCLVLDVRMPDMSGLDLLEKLPGEKITLPVIVLTGFGDIPMAVRAMKSGAVDFIEKPFNDQALLDAVYRAIEHDTQSRRERAERIDIALRAARLTPREREVMDLVADGRSNKQVAAQLGCSSKTVEVHRARVMEKMEADSLPHLVRMALTLDGASVATLR